MLFVSLPQDVRIPKNKSECFPKGFEQNLKNKKGVFANYLAKSIAYISSVSFFLQLKNHYCLIKKKIAKKYLVKDKIQASAMIVIPINVNIRQSDHIGSVRI